MKVLNPYSKCSLTLITLQQLLIATSTYFIAKAGASVAEHSYDQSINFIILFFVFALGGYLTSSISNYILTLSINYSIKDYYSYLFRSLNKRQEYNTEYNKNKTIAWLSGESTSTIDNFIRIITESYSVYLSIILTLAVFWLTLGIVYSLACGAGLLLAALFLMYFKKRVTIAGKDIQSSHLNVNKGLGVLWDCYYGSTVEDRDRQENAHTNRLNNLFKHNLKYSYFEQIVACTPIAIAVSIIITTLLLTGNNSSGFYGALVALLPRSLNFFGYVHDLSLMSNKAILFHSKYEELITFTKKLEIHNLETALQETDITIYSICQKKTLEPNDFIKDIQTSKITKGLYRVTGKNGCGKSSLLKLIKNSFSNAWLYQPGKNFLDDNNLSSSSGELQLLNIWHILQYDSDILLLDEWDANLDTGNTRKIDQALNALSKTTLIIEVRHKHE
jgi:ABC-type multidrug transport system fused ATPase/permease subunit